MRLLDCLYLTRARAIALGFTHEGRLFGVPAWMRDVNSEAPICCPKILVLQFYAMACDWVFESFAAGMPEDATLETPLVVTRRIDGLSA